MQGAFAPVLDLFWFALVWIGWFIGKRNQIAATQNIHITHWPVGICMAIRTSSHQALRLLMTPRHLSTSHNSQCVWLQRLVQSKILQFFQELAPEFVWKCTNTTSSRRSRYACLVCFWCATECDCCIPHLPKQTTPRGETNSCVVQPN